MKDPKEFRPQLPRILKSAFDKRRVPPPSDPVVEQLADIAVALMEQASGGNPVPSLAPFVASSRLVDQILGAKSAIAKGLRDQGQPVPDDGKLVELAAQQVVAAVMHDHASELAWALEGAKELDKA